MKAPTLTHAWLTSDEPRHRLQARLGNAYRFARRYGASPVGMLGLLIVGLLAGLALVAPWLPLQDPLTQQLSERLMPPSSVHWFGTDSLGRDIFARALWGARPTLLVVLAALALSAPLGTLIGAAAGLFGGVIDRVLMRLTDIFMAFPRLILALAVAAALGAGLWTAVLAITLTGWTPYARIARSEAASLRRAEFMQAARTLGASPWRLLWRHALPLCLPSMIVRAALDAPGIILIVAGLGFLGLGLPPPQAEWGAMVADGRSLVFEAWWVATCPGLLILLAGLGFNLCGDALRDLIGPAAR
ncbi:ABC transporter permease [Pseudomonas putida]|uniref:ABC transporter permease n=1 Tax=Pseudomonas putida TaxID=303 RepID=UPI00236482A6|nr:ABC transporter permease [Pseudomonas putida]MDD2053600.1 ABC transporter permease [Pseudomonas putida]